MKGYYTVSEYAAITGKDPGNIRRNIINGKIYAEKLGKQWIIPQNTIYPTDRRLKSGIYHNQRKKTAIRSKHPVLMKALSNMSRELRKVYGDILDEIVIYGSYARGEESQDSDVDIALFLNSSETDDIHRAMTDIVVDYELEQGKTLSVVTIETENFNDWKHILPYYKNIINEGIVLWKSA
ncbi:MAG: nucleotidyltransferase domain-containing protein [Lachnospiraceae bacterium]|nr:nucleotidyltransferase domain-containing protein [Lachnospiraceae bacterium]